MLKSLSLHQAGLLARAAEAVAAERGRSNRPAALPLPDRHPAAEQRRHLRWLLEQLTQAERDELLALFWLGHRDWDADHWPTLIDLSRAARGHRIGYLMARESTTLRDYLAEGLRKLREAREKPVNHENTKDETADERRRTRIEEDQCATETQRHREDGE